MKRISFWAVSTLSVLVLLFTHPTSTSSEKIAATPARVISSEPMTTPRQTPTAGAAPAETTPRTTTVTGDVVDTDEGPVQIELSISDGRVAGVDVVQYPTGNSQHEEVNGRALPILIQETLDAQSADIDMVSGATSTSTGYIGSLQSALDKANL